MAQRPRPAQDREDSLGCRDSTDANGAKSSRSFPAHRGIYQEKGRRGDGRHQEGNLLASKVQKSLEVTQNFRKSLLKSSGAV